MIFHLNYKKIITLLMVGLILISGLIWYKEQTTNKEIPKRANFVKYNFGWGKNYG